MASINTTGTTGTSSRMVQQKLLGTPARVLFSLTLIVGLLAVVLNAVYAQDAAPAADVAATPAATPSAAMLRIELDLVEVNESDISGKVTLYEFGDSTIVDFDVKGAGGDHPAVIVSGLCGDTADNPIADLELVDNKGKSQTVIDTSLDDLLANDHSVEIRMSKDDIDTVIACALIEGEPSLKPAGTPVASPAATPAATPSASPEDKGVGGSTTDIDGTGGAVNADATVLEVKLSDWNDTGVTGTATLTGSDSSTQVVVTLVGPGVSGGHEVHIHNGTCASPGTATYALNPVDANGTSTSTVNLSLDQLTTGSYFINVHLDEANWDAWMVCGNISGTPGAMTAVKPTAPVTVSNVSDGSVGGNITTVMTNAQAGEFPDRVGVGDGLRWPSDTRTAVTWSLAGIGFTALASGLILRHGERNGKVPRFNRLGL